MTERKDQPGQSQEKKLVSPTQVVGGALASVTAAYLGSRLGVQGTFWGAGVSSVIVSVGAAVYQRSFEGAKDKAATAAAKTALVRAKRQTLVGAPQLPERDAGTGETAAAITPEAALSTEDLDRLREARSAMVTDLGEQATRKIHPVPGAVQPGMHWPGGDQVVDRSDAADSAEPTMRIDSEDAASEPDDSSSEETKLIDKETPPAERPRPIRWAAVAVTSVVVFVVCLVLVTGFEGVTGQPLSGGPRGTSVGRLVHPNPPDTTIMPTQPETTVPEQPPVSGSTATPKPSQQSSVNPASQAPPVPSQDRGSQQETPTTTAAPTTTTTTTQ